VNWEAQERRLLLREANGERSGERRLAGLHISGQDVQGALGDEGFPDPTNVWGMFLQQVVKQKGAKHAGFTTAVSV
jgi:hypothetical protein